MQALYHQRQRVETSCHYGIRPNKNHTTYGLSALTPYWHYAWTAWNLWKHYHETERCAASPKHELRQGRRLPGECAGSSGLATACRARWAPGSHEVYPFHREEGGAGPQLAALLLETHVARRCVPRVSNVVPFWL